MTFIKVNHKPSFAKCSGFPQNYLQFWRFFLKKAPMKRFSAIFSVKALRKENLKIHWYWAFQQEAGIADDIPVFDYAQFLLFITFQ